MRDWEGTIIARVTPLGHGGVSIVRVSGPRAFEIADELADVRGGTIRDLPARFMAPASVRSDGSVWDRCLVVRFDRPHSFTGEDVVELHLHGNPLIVDHVVELAVSAGARPADPGEFTMRAVLNGKLDLLQAEAVGEAIAAESAAAIRIAQRQLGGELSRRLTQLRTRVVETIARVELELDFAEEGYSFMSGAEVRALCDDLRAEVASLQRSFRSGGRLRTGPRALLLGRPNAGKSSFFNSVLGYSRALVSETAGTTRDYLEERIAHSGLVIHLIDTAGLRTSASDLEAEGIQRSWMLLQQADFALYLVDASDPVARAASDSEVEEIRSRFGSGVVERVWTKSDRSPDTVVGISCSIHDPDSIDRVLDLIVDHCRPTSDGVEALVSERQAQLLAEIDGILTHITDVSGELLSADLRRLLAPLSSLTGDASNEDVLDAVFGGFCIGK